MAQLPLPQQLIILQRLIDDSGMQLDTEILTGLPVTVEAPPKRSLRLIANNAGNLSFNAWQDHRREHAELFFTSFTNQLVNSGHLELYDSPAPATATASNSIGRPPAHGPSASPVPAPRARTPRQDSDEEEERIRVDESMSREISETEGDHLSEDDEEEQLEDEEDGRQENEEDDLHKRWPTPDFLKGVTVTEAEEKEEMRQYHIMSRRLGDY
ncbi:uncharacterized protein J4E79_005618 [Alternaria viburni]|uniref:uncharacterized protein n=1 Tax=Alternaria viburni TaxID=566460 RepID=UPI0020C3226D|nr:uncharacterized protein J4E79_005618 [Alternaria viburni]KAI4661050.1 hypothetical protein J4E79_005618 [Alternaria viburni]